MLTTVELSSLLTRAMAGEIAVVLPQDRTAPVRVTPPELYDSTGVPGRTAPPALVVFTSGSTGAPKGVALSSRALRVSATATEEHMGGPGRWYLCLPTNHVAGVQVVLRSLQAGTTPVTASGSFTPATFTADVEHLAATTAGGVPLYTSLVPTQLVRILDDPAATQAAARFTGILLGGAAISPALLDRADASGLRIIRTYGMSETCGGCVYDGIPFAGVTVRILDEDGNTVDSGATAGPDTAGRVHLSGPVLADGYLRVEDDPEDPMAGPPRLIALPDVDPDTGSPNGFGYCAPGTTVRTFRTSDLGRLDSTVTPPRLEILGRADDVIITGGENVSPHHVEALLLRALEPHGIAEVLLTSVPDPQWGERLVALLRPATPAVSREPGSATGEGQGEIAPHAVSTRTGKALDAGAVRRILGGELPRPHLPREVLAVDRIPSRSIGKPDRQAARRLVTARCEERGQGASTTAKDV
ncbi:AMP-binding protein [Brevibacterium litoralis]|uniref:AMP-binding protein n=1 Tax=Brevibacterium litoralis TaxID=3138935 RepID=UPI0032EB318A